MDKILKVAYLMRRAEGGMKTHLLSLLSGLDRSAYEPVVICPPGTPLQKEVAQTGVTVLPLEISDKLDPLKDMQAALALRKMLRDVKPDIVHMHGMKAALVGRLAVRSKRRPKVIVTHHSYVLDERTGAGKRKLYTRIERFFLRVTDRVIAVSQALKDELMADMGIPEDLISVIYNGSRFVDLPPTPHEDIRIGVIARLAPQKGVEYFIRAAALVMTKFPQATFFIIGDGPQRASLSELVNALSIREGVYFLGQKTDIPSQLSKLDILVVPSTHESFGLVAVEALAQKVPVIASRVGGLPEVVLDGKTGLLVEPGNPAAIAEKIIQLLEDREYAVQLGEAGYADVRARFSVARMVEETEALYADVMRPQRRKART